MSFRRLSIASLLAALALGCATSAPTPDMRGAAERLKADIAWLADDAREGREAGTPGYDAAAGYVIDEFEAAGLSPGVDGGWRQTVPLRTSIRDLDAARLTLDGNGGFQTLVHLTDYIVGRSFTDANYEASGELVYAGYGVSAPSENYDDYAGLDVAGKIVVAFGGAPRGFSTEIAAYFSDTETKQATAAAKGAVGFISIQSNSSGYPWPVAVKSAGAPAMIRADTALLERPAWRPTSSSPRWAPSDALPRGHLRHDTTRTPD